MNRNLLLLAAAAIASTAAYADEDPNFVSTRTRAEVSAEARTPYPGGNPWSAFYNMFQGRSTATSTQVQADYIATRDRVNSFHGEDSGSMFIMKARGLAPAPTSAMVSPGQ